MVIEEQIATKSVELVFENKSAGMQIVCFYNRFIIYDKYCLVYYILYTCSTLLTIINR